LISKIVVEGKKSTTFAITSEVRQGDGVAAVQFNLALEYVIGKSVEYNEGYKREMIDECDDHYSK
jgi:hypothetical protein